MRTSTFVFTDDAGKEVRVCTASRDSGGPSVAAVLRGDRLELAHGNGEGVAADAAGRALMLTEDQAEAAVVAIVAALSARAEHAPTSRERSLRHARIQRLIQRL
jgi:hypothetical protein